MESVDVIEGDVLLSKIFLAPPLMMKWMLGVLTRGI